MSNISTPNNFVVAPDILSKLGNAPFKDSSSPPQKQKLLDFIADPKLAEAKWNLSGVFLYDNTLLGIFAFFTETVPTVNIESLSGAAPCLWTLEWFGMRNLIPPATINARLKAIGKLNTNFVLQLDNPFIPETGLDDLVGISQLNLCAQLKTMNVCVASEKLAEQIRKNFPNAKLHAGINKVIAENAAGNLDYYCNAAEHYERVAIHPVDACRKDFLEQLANKVNPEKFEITLNDTCLRTCPLRREHLETLAKMRNAPWDAKLLQYRHSLLERAKCETLQPLSKENLEITKPALLTREELYSAYKLGYRHFRIQAETLRSEIAFFWEAMRWLIPDTPELWAKRALILSAIVSKISTPTPIVKTGIEAFLMRKYD